MTVLEAAQRGRTLSRYVPGVVVLVGLAVVARVLGTRIPYVTPLVLAVVLGLVVGNTVSLPAWIIPGARTHNLWLAAGIVLMGARISVETLCLGTASCCSQSRLAPSPSQSGLLKC